MESLLEFQTGRSMVSALYLAGLNDRPLHSFQSDVTRVFGICEVIGVLSHVTLHIMKSSVVFSKILRIKSHPTECTERE